MNDVESPEHLERLRDRTEFKLVLLRWHAGATPEARYERAPKNADYRDALQPLIDAVAAGTAALPLQEPCLVYGRPCWRLGCRLGDKSDGALAIAIASADGASPEALLERLRDVSRDHWYGSSFFK